MEKKIKPPRRWLASRIIKNFGKKSPFELKEIWRSSQKLERELALIVMIGLRNQITSHVRCFKSTLKELNKFIAWAKKDVSV